jgi:hypothetical protein
VTKNEEVELLWRACEVLSHPDPGRRALAWDAIHKLAHFTKDPAVQARAQRLIAKRTSVVWIQDEDRTALIDLAWGRPSAALESRIWEVWLGRAAAR